MATCKECLHEEVCQEHCDAQHCEGCSVCLIYVCHYLDGFENAEKCRLFKTRTERSGENAAD